MIQEELTKLADEPDDEDEGGDAEKDETQSAGQEVEAWWSSNGNMTARNCCRYLSLLDPSFEFSCTTCNI